MRPINVFIATLAMTRVHFVHPIHVISILFATLATTGALAETYPLTVMPAEHKRMNDPVTNTELTFLTTAPGKNLNAYFYQQAWLHDGSAILFNSDRNEGGAMAYLVQTGELVMLRTPKGPLRQPVASMKRPVFFARRGREVLELRIDLTISADLAKTPSTATLEERVICLMPEGSHSSYLTENPDGTKLTLGIGGIKGESRSAIFVVDIASGEVKEVCSFPDPPGFAWHVQWSWTDPNLISFAGRPQRLMTVDIRDGRPRNIYKAWDDELVTHESSWVNGQVLFCGGTHPKPAEDSHVKVLDLATGTVRVIGPGAWWPGANAPDLAKVNWWHASGSRDGRWVAADNWHGDIMLFDAKTARPRLLTTGHRTYGHGEHPHVAWDQTGKSVIFGSHMLGDPNVCVAKIPEAWQEENP
jgi:oligogalacturonide lyase